MTESAQLGVALPPGTLLGHCEVREVLGRGGGGISYRAYDAHLEREVVIKEHFPPTLCFRVPGEAMVQHVTSDGYERSIAAFCREARILAGVNHPGVVKVHDIFQACGTAYMVMEYVEGARLTEWLPEHADDSASVTAVLNQLLEALGYLHAHDVLHRDIKPSNIIIRTGNHPVLIDFGAAMLGTPPTTITLVGTPGYAAPEQFQQHGKVGPWSDLYALAHSFSKLIPRRNLRKYPRCFVSSLMKASRPDWEQRLSSATEWAALLQKRPCRWFSILGCLIACALLVGFCYVWLRADELPAFSDNGGDNVQSTTAMNADAAVLSPDVISRLQNSGSVEVKGQLQELKDEQHKKLLKFAEQMNSMLPDGKGKNGWVVLPGQGETAR